MSEQYPLVLAFTDEGAGSLPLAGGKASNLARTAQAGFPVPDGFVITTEAYRRRGEPAVAAAVLAAYRELGGGRVAVRSSATAEDLEGASFAGQQTTLLGIQGEGRLLEAVAACWDSLLGQRAVEYRRAHGISDDGVAMAVVVQQLVAAVAAGVLFTRDPTDPAADRMLVEAAWGLGEAVVSGRVTPDRWSLRATDGGVLSREVNDKRFQVAPDGEAPVPEDLRRQATLTDTQLGQLAELGRRLEAFYGAPQDAEWAIARGEIYLLQSRPITASGGEREAVRAQEIARLRSVAEPDGTVWARYSLAEVLPEPLPLSWACWRQFMTAEGGYGRMYRDLGYDPDPALDAAGVLDLICGRPYFNLSRDRRMYFSKFPYDYPFAKLKANPALAIYPSPEANLARAPKGFLLKMVGVTRQMLAAERTLDRAAEEVPVRLDTEVYPKMAGFADRMRAADLTALSGDQLREAITETRRYVFDEFLPDALKPSLLAGIAMSKLKDALRAGAAGEQAGAVEALLVGVEPPQQCHLGAALNALAKGILPLPEFLAHFGHRGPGEMELANPRWRELGSVAVSAGAAPRPVAAAPEPRGANARKHLARARRLTALREASKHFLMLGYEALRLLLLELDRRAALNGGVFWLEPGELAEALAGGAELRPRIAERRKRRALALGLEAPRVLFSDDLDAIGRPVPAVEGGVSVSGTGVSAGTAEGPALVLRSPDDAPPAARDFILVCPSTDPGWVPLFLRARGLVLETGGVLSHGAIVAREFGIPAVANVPEACRRFTDGQVLRVDGSRGTVTPVPV